MNTKKLGMLALMIVLAIGVVLISGYVQAPEEPPPEEPAEADEPAAGVTTTPEEPVEPPPEEDIPPPEEPVEPPGKPVTPVTTTPKAPAKVIMPPKEDVTIELISSKDGEEIDTTTPRFEWNAVDIPNVDYSLIIWKLPEELVAKIAEGYNVTEKDLTGLKSYFVKEGIKRNSFVYPEDADNPLLPGFYYWQINAFDVTGNLIGTSEVRSFVAPLLLFFDINLGSDVAGIARSDCAVGKLDDALDTLKSIMLKKSEFEVVWATDLLLDMINIWLPPEVEAAIKAWEEAAKKDPTLGVAGVSTTKKDKIKSGNLYFKDSKTLNNWKAKTNLPHLLKKAVKDAKKAAGEPLKKAKEAKRAEQDGNLEKAKKAEKEKKDAASQVKKLLANAEKIAKEMKDTAERAAKRASGDVRKKWEDAKNKAKEAEEDAYRYKSNAEYLVKFSDGVLALTKLFERLKAVRDDLKNNNTGKLSMFNKQKEVVKGIKEFIKGKDRRDIDKYKSVVKNIREASSLLAKAAIDTAEKARKCAAERLRKKMLIATKKAREKADAAELVRKNKLMETKITKKLAGVDKELKYAKKYFNEGNKLTTYCQEERAIYNYYKKAFWRAGNAISLAKKVK